MTAIDLPVVLRPLLPLALDFGGRLRRLGEDADSDVRLRADAQLDLTVERQKGEFLCWAAVTQAVLKCFKTVKTQCQIVSEVRNSECCAAGAEVGKDCDQARNVNAVLQKYGALEGEKDSCLPSELDEEIKKERPVCVQIDWIGPDGKIEGLHTAVIINVVSGKAELTLSDSLYGTQTWTYGTQSYATKRCNFSKYFLTKPPESHAV